LFKRKAKRSHLWEWPISQVLSQVRICYTTDPFEWEVRAAVVLHQDPALLPDGAASLAQGQAAESGEPFEGLAEYVVAKLAFAEKDRIHLYMDFDPVCLVYEADAVMTVAEADESARAWVGDSAVPMPFEHIPGIFQAQFVSFILQREVEGATEQFSWVLPPQGDVYPFREFPPRTHPTEFTPRPGVVTVGLLPSAGVRALYSQRGW
jgi:hypothetical protein